MRLLKLGSDRWLRLVFIATTLVFVGVALYIYAFRFFDWLESDAAVTVVLGAKVLAAKSPVVGNWYYANGDVWGFAPQLFAVVPVAVLGIGPAALFVTVVGGFVLELVVFVKVHRRLAGETWIAMFATMTTLMAWSNAHVAYEYIQLAYGFVTCLYLVSFTSAGAMAEAPGVRPWRLTSLGVLVAVISVQNPIRGLVFVLVPVFAGCLWPWRSFALRRRLALSAVAAAGWGVAYVVYTTVFARLVTFSIPRGHTDFFFRGASGIKANLQMLGRGLMLMCSGSAEASVWAVPGILIGAGAFALVVREAITSRALTALRFVSVVLIAQFGIVLVPLVFGSLLVDPESTRYLMPSMLGMLGVAVMIAVRATGDASQPSTRRLAIGWLVTIPLAAVVAAPQARPPTPQTYVWPNARELDQVAGELVKRGLTHGFANVLHASLITLDSHGEAMTCPIYFRNIIMPQRWLTDTSCYTASELPAKFYVVADRTEHDHTAIHATLPPPAEHFIVSENYEVFVYTTATTPLAWLALPILDGGLATFPMRLPATHLQLFRDKATVEAKDVVATGEAGTVIYGPYVELPKGDYTMTWNGTGIPSSGRLAFSVTAARTTLGKRESLDAASIPTIQGPIIKLAFTLRRARQALEFVVDSEGGGRVSLHELVIERK